jgi:hypothetical protein
MNCEHPWNREFLDDVFPKTWVNGEYAKHREKVLLDREKARLPASQHLVINYKIAEELKQTVKDEAEEMTRLKRRIAVIANNRDSLNVRIGRIVRSQYSVDGRGVVRADQGQQPERTQFVCKCPAQDCRGFLSTQYKCGVCSMFTCPDCREVIGASKSDPHECDPHTKETVALLKKDSKPCPSCGTNIFKVSGCEQMWCTMCHTAFSWRTGQVVQGVIHNPHYFEYMRSRGTLQRQPGDVPCGGGGAHFSVHELHRRFNDADKLEHSVSADTVYAMRIACEKLLQMVRHVRYEVLGGAQLQLPDEDANIDLRIKYLMKEIDEPTWRRILQQREKKRDKIIAFRQVYELLHDVAVDCLRALEFQSSETVDEVLRKFENEMDGLLKFVAASLKRISERFHCSIPFGDVCLQQGMAYYKPYIKGQEADDIKRRRLE